MASTSRKMKIARPAARKHSGKAKLTSGSARQATARKPEQPLPIIEATTPRRRVVELPKVQGELPTPTSTFYF